MSWLLYILGAYLIGCYVWGMYVAIRIYSRRHVRELLPRRRATTSPDYGFTATMPPPTPDADTTTPATAAHHDEAAPARQSKAA